MKTPFALRFVSRAAKMQLPTLDSDSLSAIHGGADDGTTDPALDPAPEDEARPKVKATTEGTGFTSSGYNDKSTDAGVVIVF